MNDKTMTPDNKLVDELQGIKNKATRQFRHNGDNSPNINKPEQGFVIAYDCKVIDAALTTLADENKRLRDEIHSLMNTPPCRECGAMTEKDAETKCRCAGDKDHCHGCDLWGR